MMPNFSVSLDFAFSDKNDSIGITRTTLSGPCCSYIFGDRQFASLQPFIILSVPLPAFSATPNMENIFCSDLLRQTLSPPV